MTKIKKERFIRSLIEYTGQAKMLAEDGNILAIETLIDDLSSIKEDSKLFFEPDGSLNLKKTLKKQEKRDKKTESSDTKVKKIKMDLDSLPNHIELTGDPFFPSYRELSFYSPKIDSDITEKWREMGYEDQPLSNDLFIKFIQQNYEIVRSVRQYNPEKNRESDLDTEYCSQQLSSTGWSITDDFEFQQNKKHGVNSISLSYHLLIKKKKITSPDKAPTIERMLWSGYEEPLDLSLADAIKHSNSFSTLIFVEENSLDYWEKMIEMSDQCEIPQRRSFNFLVNEDERAACSLTQRYKRPRSTIVIPFSGKDAVAIQKTLEEIAADSKGRRISVVIVDKDYKNSRITFASTPAEVAAKFRFMFASDSLNSFPIGVVDGSEQLEYFTFGVDNIFKIRDKDRKRIRVLYIAPAENEDIKFIPQSTIDEFSRGNYNQTIATSKIVAKDYDDFMEKAKANLGIAKKRN